MKKLTVGIAMTVGSIVWSGIAAGSADCPDGIWKGSEWLAVPDAPVATAADRKAQNAAPGANWFVGEVVNARAVRSAKWTTTGLGVYELYVNGKSVGGDEALKPGFTHVKKTRRSFTTDVTGALDRTAGAKNVLAAEVTAGWWCDQIVAYAGKKSAFRGVLELTYEDGSKQSFGTETKTWTCAVGGPVKRAAIFDGELYDARVAKPVLGGDGFKAAEVSTEFSGEILPSRGAEIRRRFDLALTPVEAYNWKGATGAVGVEEAMKTHKGWEKVVFGKVVKTATFDPKGALKVVPGETLVVDFGQNCAAVPAFEFVAKPGVTLTCLPGEMLNDANGERSRGNDGPGGSLYRENLRIPATGMRLEYTFASDRPETYMPRHTFFGYRYVSITATDAVTIKSIKSIPVTSIAKDMELGRIETGVKDVNRLIANVYWGQLSNYLSVPTDCPQRNERLGWTADTQVFAEAGSFNADTSRFFHKWTRDLRDNQGAEGGYPGVAPFAQYGNETMRLGWTDVGVIVPYQVWKQFGDTAIVEENWAAMEKFMTLLDATKADHAANVKFNGNYQWADWLSFEGLESCSGRSHETRDGKWVPRADAIVYWNYLAACYWMWDAQMMADMAVATGRDVAKWTAMAERAKAHLVANFIDKADGLLIPLFRPLQTPAVFALKLGLLDAAAAEKTLAALRENVKAHDGCLTTGFLGTSVIMDTLTAYGADDLAYSLLLNHKHPSWLYSVDQGATTIWERWNSYTKKDGFGPVGMNSFNHYAYGAVLAWIYKTAAGIAADPKAPGFKNIIMAPKPDRRLGFVKAEYRTPHGLVRSAWRYEGEKWIWEFTVPEGATASVTLPGETAAKTYRPGTYQVCSSPRD